MADMLNNMRNYAFFQQSTRGRASRRGDVTENLKASKCLEILV